jgi:hypothetical protein
MSESESQTDEDKEKQIYYSVFKGKYYDFINNIYFLISCFYLYCYSTGKFELQSPAI